MPPKHQLQIPSSQNCLGDTAVRIYGVTLLNQTSDIMVQYLFKKCYRKQLNKFCISKNIVD